MKNLLALDHQEAIEELNDKIDTYGPFSKLFNECNKLVARLLALVTATYLVAPQLGNY